MYNYKVPEDALEEFNWGIQLWREAGYLVLWEKQAWRHQEHCALDVCAASKKVQQRKLDQFWTLDS